jgi:hypothetical protein
MIVTTGSERGEPPNSKGIVKMRRRRDVDELY